MPLAKSYDEILESMADSFANIEIQDVRVGKVMIPPEYLTALRADPRSQFLADWNFGSMPQTTYYEPQTEAAVNWPTHYENARVQQRNTPRIDWNETRGDAHDSIYGLPPYQVIGKIWGAELVVGHKFMVCGDAGFEHITYPVMKSFLSGIYVHVKSRAEFTKGYPKNEWVALNTLREMVTEAEFRKYLKYGFLLVKGASGDVYQIWRMKHHINVWSCGRMIREVCVYIRDESIPLTDKVVAFKTIIEADEQSFLKMGNVYNMEDRRRAAA